MDTDSESLYVGDFSDESFDFKEITWTVYSTLSLPNLIGVKVLSPPFHFANATWKLLMYPYGKKEETKDYIALGISRLNFQNPEQYVYYKFKIIAEDGEEFESFSSSRWFNAASNAWVAVRFLSKSKIIEMNNSVEFSGDLTVVCQIRTKKIAGEHRFSQTELVLSLSGSNNDNDSEISTSVHENKLICDLKEIYLKQEDCDVVMKVKGQEFSAHKLILKARSPVFASAFQSDMKEKSSGVIDIDDCDPSTFSNFLSFLYSGDVGKLSVENVFSLFTTADKYDVQDLRKECIEFMKNNISVDTFCDTIYLALLHSETELINLSTDFFASNLQEIIVTLKWQRFLAENPTYSNELLIKTLVNNKNLK